jgi:hypothetical protein
MASGAQAANETYRMIRQAIIDKDIVVATYHGHVREMCPHVIGQKRSRAQALFYQSAGGAQQNWGPTVHRATGVASSSRSFRTCQLGSQWANGIQHQTILGRKPALTRGRLMWKSKRRLPIR